MDFHVEFEVDFIADFGVNFDADLDENFGVDFNTNLFQLKYVYSSRFQPKSAGFYGFPYFHKLRFRYEMKDQQFHRGIKSNLGMLYRL